MIYKIKTVAMDLPIFLDTDTRCSKNCFSILSVCVGKWLNVLGNLIYKLMSKFVDFVIIGLGFLKPASMLDSMYIENRVVTEISVLEYCYITLLS